MNQPWFSNEAVEFLDSIVTPNSVVFEYGSGSSTLWFADRAKKVYSVEHNKKWFAKVSENLPSNVELIYRPIASPRRWRRSGKAIRPHNWKKYASTITEYDCQFDIVLIDGRLRRQSILASIPKIKSGGWLIVDDSQREWYKCTYQHINSQRQFSFDNEHQTTFWQVQ